MALSPENRDRLAGAIVNRLWRRFYGNGFALRVDQMHAKNEPSHPEIRAVNQISNLAAEQKVMVPMGLD